MVLTVQTWGTAQDLEGREGWAFTDHSSRAQTASPEAWERKGYRDTWQHPEGTPDPFGTGTAEPVDFPAP